MAQLKSEIPSQTSGDPILLSNPAVDALCTIVIILFLSIAVKGIVKLGLRG